jgi:hypothetical protein
MPRVAPTSRPVHAPTEWREGVSERQPPLTAWRSFARRSLRAQTASAQSRGDQSRARDAGSGRIGRAQALIVSPGDRSVRCRGSRARFRSPGDILAPPRCAECTSRRASSAPSAERCAGRTKRRASGPVRPNPAPRRPSRRSYGAPRAPRQHGSVRSRRAAAPANVLAMAERHRSRPTLAGRLLPERLAPWRGPCDNGNAPPRGVIGLSTGVRTFDHRWI